MVIRTGNLLTLVAIIIVWAVVPVTQAAMWVSGSNIPNQVGVYGTKGTAGLHNVPGARYGSVSWIDDHDNLWLFGGIGMDAIWGWGGYWNDLWKFDGTKWTWVSGSSEVNQPGFYSTQYRQVGSMYVPGSRYESLSWIDRTGNLWLFGGEGYDSSSRGLLNDLWKFDGTNWIWVSGSNACNRVADNSGPGSRRGGVSWIDASGCLWLFGGEVFGYSGGNSARGYLCDLWKFDPTSSNPADWCWTFMGGSLDIGEANGFYGTKQVADSHNRPGGRYGAISWIDAGGNLWLFGGYGYPSMDKWQMHCGYLNDLWRFERSTGRWMWVSGSDDVNESGTYGTQGAPSQANVPGARRGSISWIDTNGYLWLFGGYGCDAGGNVGLLNDLWKFDPTSTNLNNWCWTWVKGSDVANRVGIYGTRGTANADYIPGGRYGSVSWLDRGENLWLFGGWGYAASAHGGLNDLWQFVRDKNFKLTVYLTGGTGGGGGGGGGSSSGNKVDITALAKFASWWLQ